jgi:hypothetical protein
VYGSQCGFYCQLVNRCVFINIFLQLPILATQHVREAYTYLDDRIFVHEPATMGSIRAIQALRAGSVTAFLASDPSGSGIRMSSNHHVVKAVNSMVHSGWIRQKEGLEDMKRQIWSRNEAAVGKLLRDL